MNQYVISFDPELNIDVQEFVKVTNPICQSLLLSRLVDFSQLMKNQLTVISSC